MNRRAIEALLALVLALAGWAGARAETQVRVVSYEYNAQGLVTKETLEPDLPNDCQQTSYTYDAWGNRRTASLSTCPGASGNAIASASTPRTSTSTFSADGRFAVGATNALGHAETRVHDAKLGVMTSLTGPNNLSTTWQYDGFGRKTRETRSDGTYTTWQYKLCTDSGANCPGAIGPGVPVWAVIEQGYAVNNTVSTPERREYLDKLGRKLRSQTQGFAGQLIVQDAEYNAQGLVARTSAPYFASGGTPVWTNHSYDALGRVTESTRPDAAAAGGVATTSFSYAGHTRTITNAKSQTKTVVSGARGKILSVTDAKGSVITYGWDARDQLVQVNAAGAITSLTYSKRGWKATMVDASMGAWAYAYNALGELVWQRDSLSQVTTLSYDALGRMTQRSEPDLVSNWSYDKKFDNTACGKGIGKLCEATANNGYRRVHTYDALGRAATTATVLDNPASPATVSETFDPNTGRLATKTWPTGLQATYGYTSLGYLQSVSVAGSVSYTVQAMNALGQVTQWTGGNQVTTLNTYDPQTLRLTGIQATASGQPAGNVLNHAYTWDPLGNLATRADNTPGVGTQESFSYDSVNRLTLASLTGGAVSPPTVTEVMYDARDNITYKSDVGRYWYDAARPNRMTQVTLETAPGAQVALNGTRALSYAFDDTKPGAQVVGGTSVGNGNLLYTVSQDTPNNRHTVRAETYTSFNMPLQIVFGNFVTATTSTADRTLTFVYGPEHQRIRQTVALSGTGTSSYTSGTTWYLNGVDSLGLAYEKHVTTAGLTEHKHYVSAGSQVFALQVTRSGNLGTQTTSTTSYLHTDHLGSVAVITDAAAAVAERLAYDPWGKRRFASGLRDNLDAITGQKTDRGYTLHEHLDEVGVVHMNARVYDPLIGRFMSADSVLPDPTNLKAFNRYSYVINNPLRMVDPTGNFFEFIFGGGDASGSFDIPVGDWGPDYRSESNTFDSRDNFSRAGGWEVVYDSSWAQASVQTEQAAGSYNEYRERLGLQPIECRDCVGSVGAEPNMGHAATVAAAAGMLNPISQIDHGIDDVGSGERYKTIPPSGGGGPPIGGGGGGGGGGPAPRVTLPVSVEATGSAKGPIHHICTNKNCVSSVTGGPWTPRFEAIFEKAGMKLDDALNKIAVPGHKGPHPEAYHQVIYDRLTSATNGLSGSAYSSALQTELNVIGREIQTSGSLLNRLVVKP